MFASLSAHFGRWPVRRIYVSQLYFSGVQSIGVALLAGAALGAIIVSLIQDRFAQSSVTAIRILAISTVQETAPLMIGLLFAARSASAQATELATMRVTGELRTLRRLGISVREYLLWPRVITAAASCTVLYLYFAAAALLVGTIITPASDTLQELREAMLALPASQLLLGLGKCALFGAMVSLIACRLGLSARTATTEIPRLASRAVLYGVVSLLLLDAWLGLSLQLWS